MRLVIVASLLLKISSCCKLSPTRVGGTRAPRKFCSGDLIFEDDFDVLDVSVWEHETTLAGGGNWEFQWYTNNRTNSYVDDGVLNIIPTLTADDVGEDGLQYKTLNLWGGAPAETCTDPAYYGCERTGSPQQILNPTKSARIRSLNSFYFAYGKVEVRAKMPVGDWLWPAVWLMPRFNAYGGWPASGEIDIVEARSNAELILDGVNIGIQQVGSTLHWGPSRVTDKYPATHWVQNDESGYHSDFHLYSMYWTPNGISFKIDNEEIGGVSPDTNFWDYGNFSETHYKNPWGNSRMAPFDQEFYFIINLAVGGINFFPDNALNVNGNKPWKNNSPQASTDFWNGRNSWLATWNGNETALQVDYIRVYAI